MWNSQMKEECFDYEGEFENGSLCCNLPREKYHNETKSNESHGRDKHVENCCLIIATTSIDQNIDNTLSFAKNKTI